MLKGRDAEVRDALLSHFGRKTVEELTDMSRRPEMKKEVLALMKPLFPAGTIRAVYFPQFVIQ
jgi:flagellar basal body-associated protein FliL